MYHKKFIKLLRKIHSWVGFIFSIFFVITSITGIILVFRKEIPKSLKDFVFTLHTYEFGILKYWAIVIGISLLILSISGTIIFIDSKFRKNKNENKNKNNDY